MTLVPLGDRVPKQLPDIKNSRDGNRDSRLENKGGYRS